MRPVQDNTFLSESGQSHKINPTGPHPRRDYYRVAMLRNNTEQARGVPGHPMGLGNGELVFNRHSSQDGMFWRQMVVTAAPQNECAYCTER